MFDQNSRLLVTGGSGFVGQECLKLLRARNIEIHAVSRRLNEAARADERVKWHQIDLHDAQAIRTRVHEIRPTHLLHLAWYTEHGKFWTAPENVEWVALSLNLVRAFQQSGGKRVVAIGSCAEYEWGSDLCREDSTPLRPHSLYGVCKSALHTVIANLARQERFQLAWARLFLLYGVGEHPARLVPSLILPLLRRERAVCYSSQSRRDVLHVRDAAEALIALLDSCFEGPVNVASGETMRLGDLAELIGRELGCPDMVENQEREFSASNPRVLGADIEVIRNALRWSPRVPLQLGLAETVNWWASQPGAGGRL